MSIRYQLFIRKILHSKKKSRIVIIIVVIFSIFSYLLVPLGFVKNEFFPKTDSDQIYVSVELPAGTNIETSKKEAFRIMNTLKDVPDLELISLDLGNGLGEFGNSQSATSNKFLYTLVF